MHVVQYHHTFDLGKSKLVLSPWIVDYQGESDAEFARKDTQFDNRFIRFSGKWQYQKFQFGMDWGRSLNSFEQAELIDYKNQKESWAIEAKYGSLKNPGQTLVQLRHLHVERFSVVSEFAQNAVSRFATSNFSGFDLRVRRKMAENWWLGMRLSDTQTLVGKKEKGLRFRIEAKVTF